MSEPLVILDEVQLLHELRTPFWKYAMQANPQYLRAWKAYQAGLITHARFRHLVAGAIRAARVSEQAIEKALAEYPTNAHLRPYFRTIAPFSTTNEGKKS